MLVWDILDLINFVWVILVDFFFIRVLVWVRKLVVRIYKIIIGVRIYKIVIKGVYLVIRS